MPQEQADPVTIYETATTQARTVLQRVKPEQMKQSTPCSEWDVEALINHLVSAQNGIAGTVSGSQVAAGSTPLETLDAAVLAMVAAAKAPGGLEKKVQGRQGEVPAGQMLNIGIMDVSLHTWDLAKATGQDTTLDPRVVEHIFPAVEEMAQRGPSPAFATPTESPANASRQDKMIALSGRTP